jgi:hypothetical protein
MAKFTPIILPNLAPQEWSLEKWWQEVDKWERAGFTLVNHFTSDREGNTVQFVAVGESDSEGKLSDVYGILEV